MVSPRILSRLYHLSLLKLRRATRRRFFNTLGILNVEFQILKWQPVLFFKMDNFFANSKPLINSLLKLIAINYSVLMLFTGFAIAALIDS